MGEILRLYTQPEFFIIIPVEFYLEAGLCNMKFMLLYLESETFNRVAGLYNLESQSKAWSF